MKNWKKYVTILFLVLGGFGHALAQWPEDDKDPSMKDKIQLGRAGLSIGYNFLGPAHEMVEHMANNEWGQDVSGGGFWGGSGTNYPYVGDLRYSA